MKYVNIETEIQLLKLLDQPGTFMSAYKTPKYFIKIVGTINDGFPEYSRSHSEYISSYQNIKFPLGRQVSVELLLHAR